MKYQISTWQTSAYNQIDKIFKLKIDTKWDSLCDLIKDMNDAYDQVVDQTNSLQNTSLESITYKDYIIWEYLSIKSIYALRIAGIEITKTSILNTLISKQRDYGKVNISRFGTPGVIIRMSDKLSRLSNLLEKSQYDFNKAVNINAVQGESVVDTIIDIIGYSIIGMMLLTIDPESGQSEFMLPLI